MLSHDAMLRGYTKRWHNGVTSDITIPIKTSSCQPSVIVGAWEPADFKIYLGISTSPSATQTCAWLEHLKAMDESSG